MSTIVLIMRTALKTPKTLGNLLFGQTRGGVLKLLYGSPDQSFYVRQIARETGISSVGAVQRELETMAAVGLINRSTVGNQVFYQANRQLPGYEELHSLIAKTVGIIHVLRSALAPLAKHVSVAFVYGSIAAGTETPGSDVDLMVIGDVTMDEVVACLTPAEGAVGRPINPTVYSLREFRSKRRAGNHFINAVVHGKNEFLIGDEDDLRKVA
jgi:hypothetical protein